MLLSRTRKPPAFESEEEFGWVRLTKYQVEYLINTVIVIGKRIHKPSTQAILDNKIRTATGSKLKYVQLMCWYAYSRGLVKF